MLSKILKKLGENSKIKTCSYYFEKWETQFPEINVLSAERFYIVHYIMHLLQIGNTFSVTRMSYFGLNYFHSIVGYQNLCPSSLPYNVLEGIKRLLAYSATNKSPVTVSQLHKMYNYFWSKKISLYEQLRTILICVLFFMDFLWFSEVIKFRRMIWSKATLFYLYLLKRVRQTSTEKKVRLSLKN